MRVAVVTGLLGVMVAAPSFVGAPATVAEATKRKPAKTACQRLKANNRDRSPDRRLVLVLRGDGDEGRIYACVLPRGKVRRLAEWSDGLGRDGAEIAGTAGTFVLIGISWGDQYGGASSSLARMDVRTGRRVLLAGFSCNANLDGCRSGTEYRRAVIAPSGAGALELFDLDTRGHFLYAFDSEGS